MNVQDNDDFWFQQQLEERERRELEREWLNRFRKFWMDWAFGKDQFGKERKWR